MWANMFEEDIEEESGWTSYLETDFFSASLSSESSTYSNCRHKIQHGSKGEDNCRLARIRRCNRDDDEHKAVNIEEEGAKSIIREAADEESSESSNYNSCVRATLSDASSFSSSSPPFNVISQRPLKRFHPKLHQLISHPQLLKESAHRIHQCNTTLSHAAAANILEDTATSSPSSALMNATEDGASSCSSTSPYKVDVNETHHIFYEDGNDAVSTRFKALEALIPRLKEVAGKGKEEEMVKVIERHVRHLELQVELLSSAWQLSQLKHLN